MVAETDDPRAAFVEASFWHGSKARADAILATHPQIAGSDIYMAATLGDADAVRRFVAQDPAHATAKGGPRNVDPLTYLCFSTYLRDDRERSADFVRAATALLDAGADVNTGFFDPTHRPEPEWESAIYGAAGVAHHPGLTRLLIERGANPNDEETPYHAPETWDNAALRILVESGQLNAQSLETMLLRKADWHDTEGIKYLLEHGADPNRMSRWSNTAMHQALRRDNALENIEAFLDAGADPSLKSRSDNRSSISIAARRGRKDVLDTFERRGHAIVLEGVERLIAACARNDAATIADLTAAESNLIGELLAEGPTVLAEFAGTWNVDGVRELLDLGVPIDALYDGDPYFGIPRNSTALHVAAWKAAPKVVSLLIERGAAVNVVDGHGRTPLALAVRACVDSHWTHRRSPATTAALLRAGARVDGIKFPSGYRAVDELLEPHIKTG
jgi:ankyrin repeat protein